MDGHIFVRGHVSTIEEDKRGIHVADFSSRGSSLLYPHNIVPGVIAPGYAILAPQMSVYITNSNKVDFSSNCTIQSGTSFACPLVAGYASLIRSYHPIWSASVVKSAIITTGTRNNISFLMRHAVYTKCHC